MPLSKLLTVLGGLFIVTLTGCIKNLTRQKTIYANDFESGLDGIKIYNRFGEVPSPDKIWHFYGSKRLGPFNNEAFEVRVGGLDPHQLIRVEFDLYVHDKWEGNAATDLWQIVLDHQVNLLTTFSNTSAPQSYPDWYNRNNPARGNAEPEMLNGACRLKDQAGGTTKYKITRTVLHSADSFVLYCSDAISATDSTCLKSWSIDNLKIRTISNE